MTEHFTLRRVAVLDETIRRRRWPAFTIVAGLLLLAALTGSATGPPVRVIVGLRAPFVPEGRLPGRAAVQAQREAIVRAREAMISRLRAGTWTVEHAFESIPFVALQAQPETIDALRSSPDVASVREDRLLAPVLAQSVPLIGAPTAWAAGDTGAGWTIAIIDTGVDKGHPFLSGKVVSEACYSNKGNCPNKSKTQTSAGAGTPCGWAPSGCAHGTHVAGIAAGSGPSFSGVAKGASLIAVQVFSRFTGSSCSGTGEDPCALAFTSDMVAGLERVYALRGVFSVASVNVSLGGGSFGDQAACDAADPATKAAIDNLRSAGIATIAAAGNEGNPTALNSPACISSAVSVGATSKADVVVAFSNSATYLSLLAPGLSINSSVPGGGFAVFSGTSMAAPHVAGSWALARQSNPAASVTEVLDAMQLTGVPITDSRNGLTKPRIRVDRVVFTCDADAVPDSGPPPLSVSLSGSAQQGTPPYTGSWSFGDGSAPVAGMTASHDYTVPGDFTATLTVQDALGLSCRATTQVTVPGPIITGVRRKSSPFRLLVDGAGFLAGDVVRIDGVDVPATIFKSVKRLVAMKGTALQAQLPAGVPVQVTVQDPNGLTSAAFPFTR